LQSHVGDAPLTGERIDRAFGGLVVDDQGAVRADGVDPSAPPASFGAAPDRCLFDQEGNAVEHCESLARRLGHRVERSEFAFKNRDAASGTGRIARLACGRGAIVVRRNRLDRASAE
jgi:hypothetical protein